MMNYESTGWLYAQVNIEFYAYNLITNLVTPK